MAMSILTIPKLTDSRIYLDKAEAVKSDRVLQNLDGLSADERRAFGAVPDADKIHVRSIVARKITNARQLEDAKKIYTPDVFVTRKAQEDAVTKAKADLHTLTTAPGEDLQPNHNTLYDDYTAAVDTLRVALLENARLVAEGREDEAQSTQQAEQNAHNTKAALEKELVKVQPNDEMKTSSARLRARFNAFNAVKSAENNLIAAKNIDSPAERMKRASVELNAAKSELQHFKNFDTWLQPKLDAIKVGKTDNSEVITKLTALEGKVNNLPSSTGTNASDADKAAAKREGRNQVLLWGGLTAGAVVIGLIAWLFIMGNKLSHKNSQLHEAILTLAQIQAQQNASPDQSQGGPGASQTPYGYGPQQPQPSR